MDIQNLICFLELAKTLSFTKAAERLFMSQSSVTRRIQALEAEWKMPLFDRSSKNVVLTAAGKAMAEGLNRISDDYAELYLKAQNIHEGCSGEIAIGVMPEFMLNAFPSMLTSFERQYPDIHFELLSAPLEKLRSKLLAGTLDFVIGGRLDLGLKNHPQIGSILIGYRKLGIAVSAQHPLADSQAPLSLSQFKDDIFVTLPDSVVPARRNLYIRCANCGFVPKVRTAADLSTILLWVETGRCICIIYQNSSLIGNPRLRFLEIQDLVPPCMEDLVPTEAEIMWNEATMSNTCKPTFIDYIRSYPWPL